MPAEICRKCGGSGSNHDQKKPGPCPKCYGTGTVDYELLVKGYRMAIKHYQEEIRIREKTINNIKRRINDE